MLVESFQFIPPLPNTEAAAEANARRVGALLERVEVLQARDIHRVPCS